MMHNGRIRTFKPGHHKVKDGKPRHSELFKCKQCGILDTRRGRTVYCSRSCYWKARGFKVVPTDVTWSVPGKFADRSKFQVSRSARIQRLYMLAACNNKCEQCSWGDYVEVLEVHHINRDKRDGRRENMKLLCPNCHEVAHFLEKSGRYNPDRYKQAEIVKQAFEADAIYSSP